MSDVGEPDSVLNEELAQLADEETEEEAAAAEAAQSKACQDYVTSVALQRAPSNQQEYLQLDNHTFLLPNPILAQPEWIQRRDRESKLARRASVIWAIPPELSGTVVTWKEQGPAGTWISATRHAHATLTSHNP